jgi:hypothetical protein
MNLFERMLLVSYENRSSHIKSKKKLTLISSGLFMIICVINSPGLFFGLQNQKSFNSVTNTTVSSIVCTAPTIVGALRDLVGSLTRVAIPFVLQVVVSAYLIKKLLDVRHIVQHVSLKREYRYAFTIAILNAVYIIADVILLISLVFIYKYGYIQIYLPATSNASALASLGYDFATIVCVFIICDFLFFINLRAVSRKTLK